MMKKSVPFDVWVVVFVLIFYFVNRFTNVFTSCPRCGALFRFHFNDFLGAILLAAYTNILLAYKGFQAIQSLGSLLLLGGVCGVFWEGIAPLILSYSTADWKDCVAYLLGMTVYWGVYHLYFRKENCMKKEP